MANLVDLSDLDASLRNILVGVPVPVLGVGLGGHLHLLPVCQHAVPVHLRVGLSAKFVCAKMLDIYYLD
jgi:hypothetical protein